MATQTRSRVAKRPLNVVLRPGSPAEAAYRSAVLANHPISYWRLDEASGMVAADLEGAHSGTYLNAPSLGQSGVLVGDPDDVTQTARRIQ